MGRTIALLPWNPDAAVEPAKQAVLEVGATGGRVRVFVARPWGPEAWGGFLTPGQADGLAAALTGYAAACRANEARPEGAG